LIPICSVTLPFFFLPTIRHPPLSTLFPYTTLFRSTRSHFSADKLIPNPEVSVSQGAIRGWDRQRPYYYGMIQKVAEHFDFSLETPWNELDADIKKKFLYGTGKEKIDLS